MRLERNQKIVFVGDSITDAGRTWGQGDLGQGYVKLLHDLLTARHPQLNLQVVNSGVGGDTVRHLARRWERDVTAQQPNWVSIKIGVNDVRRAFAGNPQEAVPPEEFGQGLRDLLARTRAAGAQPLLIAPFLIEPDRTDPMRQRVEQYAAIVKQVGEEQGVPTAELQPAFDNAVFATSPEVWAPDRVHPSDAGHTLIALEALRLLGVPL